MKIDSMEREGVVVLRLAGRMTLEQIPFLDESLKTWIELGKRHFVLNMLDVTDISSSGIGRVLALFKTLQTKGGRLALSELSAVCEYVLDLAQLDDVFPTYKTDAEAIASFPRLRKSPVDGAD